MLLIKLLFCIRMFVFLCFNKLARWRLTSEAVRPADVRRVTEAKEGSRFLFLIPPDFVCLLAVCAAVR